jgi:4-hydroxythreonine-4-phosphate dehydrogenase
LKNLVLKKAAVIHSISNTANTGGNIGWVNQGQLSEKINNAVASLDLGNYTKPFNSAGGSIILQLKNIKDVSVEDIDRELELSRIIKAEKNRQYNEFSIIHFKKIENNFMLKNFNPIIVVAGEPRSVFFELFFKTFGKFRNNPIILIANKKLLINHLKLLKIKKPIRSLNSHEKINFKILDNKKINLIDVPLIYNSLKNIKIDNSNQYINKCFDIAIELIKKNKKLKLINGPIIKKNFLGKKHLGITEFLGSKFNAVSDVVMLIYNKNLSVSPLTTHIPLKDVSKFISKKRIINHVKIIRCFYKKKFNKNPSFAITGLNPHCESNSKLNEEDKIIKPAIEYLLKKKFNVSGLILLTRFF